MSQFHRILLILSSGALETPALKRARVLAKTCGAELQIHLYVQHRAIDVLRHINKDVAGMAQESALFHCREWLDEMIYDLNTTGITASGRVYWENRDAESILVNALNWRPDLLIKDAGKATALRALLPVSVDHDLLRMCPFPLYLVHGGGPGLPRKVIAAVDPTHPWHSAGGLNEKVMRAAMEFALQADACLELFSAFGIDAHSVRANDEYELQRQQHKNALEKLVRKFGVAPEHVHVFYGEPAPTLAQQVFISGAELLVIGSLCRLGLKRFVAGSVADRLVDEVACDLLALKPAGFDEEFTALFGMPLLQGQS
jgi:universal stress protein E